MDDQALDAPNGAGEEINAPVTQQEEPASIRDTIASAVAKQREGTDEGRTEPDAARTAPGEKARDGRDERGRFVEKPRDENAQQAAPKVDAKPGEQQADPNVRDQPAPPRPPSSWAPAAKVAFDKLPQEVQQAVAKREEEVNQGFAKFQEYKPIEPFIKMAKDSGTTLDAALKEYVSVEQELRKDFVNGTMQLAKRQNINPVKLAFDILARNGVDPGQDRNAGQQQQTHQQVPAVDLTPLQQRLDAFEAHITGQQRAAVNSEIDRFASDPKHPFFENVKADMGQLLNAGQAADLEEAYDKACWANREIRELLIKQQAAPASRSRADDAVQRAKAAAKATGGAPAAGFSPTQNLVAPGTSIRDTVVAAVNAQRGI